MKTVGFSGGKLLYSVGSVQDFKLFFSCIRYVATVRSALAPSENWSVLTDRLYRRYLKLDELDSALLLMRTVKDYFLEKPTSFIDWGNLRSSSETKLDISLPTVADVFSKFFLAFCECCESAMYFSKYADVRPIVRTVVTDVSFWISEQDRPLSEYDNLLADSTPFWDRKQISSPRSYDDYLADGVILSRTPLSDLMVKSYAKNKFKTVLSKKVAAQDKENPLTDTQRKYLLDEASLQEKKESKTRSKNL